VHKSIIHTYSPCKELPILFGLSDFIKGTSTLYHSTVRLGVNLYVDYSKHPISNFLTNSHCFSGSCNEEVIYFNNKAFLFSNLEIKKLLIRNDVIRILTHMELSRDKITPDNTVFIKECFTPNTRLQQYIDKLKKELPHEYNGLHIRVGDYPWGRGIIKNKDFLHKTIATIEEYILSQPCDVPILLISDNKDLKDCLKLKYSHIHTVDVEPIHLGELIKYPLLDKDLKKTKGTLAEFFLFLQSKSISSFSAYNEEGTGFTTVASKIFNIPVITTKFLDWPY